MKPVIIQSRDGMAWTLYSTATGTTSVSMAKMVARARDADMILDWSSSWTFGSSDFEDELWFWHRLSVRLERKMTI